MNIEVIQEHENRLKEAMLQSDVDTLDTLLCEQLIFTNHLGQLMTKADDIQGHRSGFGRIQSINMSEQHIRIMENTAIVSVLAEIDGTFGGVTSQATLRFTRIWQATENETLQLVAAHSTSVLTASAA
ncbi:hypothetical protein VST7929_01102 [Vibrio stylophorae]|uniref:DUF4440 domain-containing protein n=1 Tax=Vibrio stylophorae TaxID=659351 RepID=A0ABN8DSD5_9VIBR|nr:nuclear transport factor 2 family protein [Vibrio stylophorae]CAH0533238.1 hypothetical protein VST7929_01102 [Vibrio stylophorae]